MAINYTTFCTNASDCHEAIKSGLKWFPYNKGGESRRWYGNNDYVVDWQYGGKRLFGQAKIDKRNVQDYPDEMKFTPSCTWSLINTGTPTFRFKEHNISDIAGMSFYQAAESNLYLLGLCNSPVANAILKLIAPTINYQAGDIGRIPVLLNYSFFEQINKIVKELIELSIADWDSFESSWDFKCHPLVSAISKNRALFDDMEDIDLAECYTCWENECNERFNQLKAYEEELNRIFIDIYDLQDELTPAVEDKDVTVRKADLQRDLKSLISYAVGCMFGRYSLNIEGLAYAGGEWNKSIYSAYDPDRDNIIPICDEEYFPDDIVSRFCEWVKIVYGEKSWETNLDFIAKALGNKGNTSREVIRNYFLNDFFKDHCNTYSVTGSGKRPIYWLFDSGKQNGFKALIYMHRYDADTVGRVRTDYLHKAQKYVETAMQSAQYTIDNATSASEKSKATKAVTKYTKQLAEMRIYDEAIAHVANQRIEIDLDDGVKVNYAKFQGVEVAQEGKKALKVDLLAKI